MRDIREIVAEVESLELAEDSVPELARLDALVMEYFMVAVHAPSCLLKAA